MLRRPATPEQSVQRAFALDGKLHPRTLATVLKRLDGSRSAAYLLVSDGTSEKCFFFPVGACRLTSIGRRAALDLDELLMARADLPAAVRQELETAARRGKPLDDAAAQHGQQEILRELSTRIVRDELLDLVAWLGASFEYQEINPPPRFYDHRLRSVKLSLGMKPLLEEVDQACERFVKALGKRTLTDRTPVTLRSQPTPVAGVQAKTADLVASLLERGPVAFEDLLVLARKRGVDAVECGVAVLALADAGVLDLPNRPPARDPEEQRAQAQRDAGWIEGRLDLLIHELAARQRLAEACEGLGDGKRAAEHLRFVARELEGRQKLNEAMDAYRRVLKLSPRDFQLRHRIFAILERLGRLGEAFDEGLVLARDLKRFGLYNRAKQMFKKLVGMREDDVETRRELIDLLVKMKDTDEAVHELGELAAVFEGREQAGAALACQRQILALDPQNDAAKRRLMRAVRRSSRFLLPYIGLAAGLLVAAALGAFVRGQVVLTRALAEVRRAVVEDVRRRDYAGAREAIALFEARFGGDHTEGLSAQVSLLEQDARENAAARRFHEARRAELRLNIELARSEYKAVLGQHVGSRWEAMAEERLADLDRRDEEAKNLARRLLRVTDRYDREDLDERARAEAYTEAVDLGRELARKYAWSSAALRARIPVRIESVPPGAWVQIDGIGLDRLTPCTVAHPLLPPFRVSVGRAEFDEVTRIVDLGAEEPALPVRADLQRRRFWRFGTLGPVRAAPLLVEDRLVLCGTDRRVYAVSLDGRKLWDRQLGPFAELDPTPIAAPGLVVVADRRGQIAALDPKSGDVRWTSEVEGPAMVVGVSQVGTVVAWRRDRLVGLGARDGKQLWESEPLAEPLLAAPLPVDRVAVGATEAGRLLAWNMDSGRVTVHVDLKSRLTAPPVFCGSGFTIATEDGMLRVLSLENPQRPRYVWEQRLPTAATAAPGVDGGVVWVPAGERLLAFRADNGTPVPLQQDRFDGAIRASPFARAGRVYVGTGSGKLYALAATTGQVQWVYGTGAPILAPARVVRDMVFVGSADYGLHAVQN